MIDHDTLVNEGYSTFKDDTSYADCCYQKKVYDAISGNVLYFINIYEYSLREFPSSYELNLAFDVEFDGVSSYGWLKYSLAQNVSVEQIENMARQVWVMNGSVPYETD
jgi:hypothetical protein